jgi:drug/metabolite transporter (DMT)-like permease
MDWTKILYYLGIVAAILTAWAGSHLFSPHLAEILSFAAAAVVAFASTVTSGISSAAHKVAWITVGVSVISAALGYANLLGPDVVKVLSLALTTIAAATAIGHPAPENPATR